MTRPSRPAFHSDRRGGIAATAALVVPAVALLACGAIDLAAVAGAKSQAQALADAAALQAAKQLGVAEVAGIEARTDDFVQAQSGPVKQGLTYAVTTVVNARAGAVTVSLDGVRQSFFGNLLPPGGWKIHAEATAAVMGHQPLCVLTSGTGADHRISLKDAALVSAPKCLIQSNGDITVKNSAQLSAGAVQSGGQSSGAITPQAQTGAAPISDPFSSMAINPESKLCNLLDILNTLGSLGIALDVPPGVHCGQIKIGKNQSIRLMPGEHYFKGGRLILEENAEVTGTNVVLIFDKDAEFEFTESSKVNLEGRKTGSFAGFVIATTRKNTSTFMISSDSARKLLGTIYIPEATLKVTGSGNQIADQSAWTVVVAKAIELQGSPRLTINANYAGSGVPVPNGVGPTGGNVALAK